MKSEVEISKNLKLLAKTSFIVFIWVAISKVLSYIYRITIARQFGPEIYGLFSLAVMVTLLFSVFATIGLTRGIVRYISLYRGKKDIDKIRYVFRVSSFFLLVTSIIAAVILFLLAEFISINIFHNPGLIIFLKIFGISIPIYIFMSFFLSTIQAYEKIYWYSFIYNILQNAVKVAVLIILIFLGLKSSAVIFSYVLGIFLALLASYFVCKYYISDIFDKSSLGKKTRKEIKKSLFSYSWPLLFFGLVLNIFYWTDSFVIGYLKDAHSVGLYNAALPIALLLMITSELFIQLFFPLVTKEYSRKKISLIRELSKQIGKWIFLINLPVIVLLLVFPGAFINILFGSQYLVAKNALRFLAIGILFNSVFIVSHRLIIMAGKTKTVLLDIIIVAIVNLILNFILVQRYGITGAAFSTMVSLILLNLLFLFQSRHYLSIVPLKRKMISITVAAGISAFILVYLKGIININVSSIIILSLFFFLSYVLLVFILRGLDKNDFIILKSIRKKFTRN